MSVPDRGQAKAGERSLYGSKTSPPNSSSSTNALSMHTFANLDYLAQTRNLVRTHLGSFDSAFAPPRAAAAAAAE